jgi:DnaD/phage-associated family protein
MKFNFRQDVLVLPASVLSCCEKADAAAMRVLVWLASDLTLADKPRQLAKLADCSEREVKKAIELWIKTGVLATESGETVAVMATPETVVEKTEKRVLQRADTLPVYTATELADLIEKRQGMRELIDEAQQILGKMFNPSEINILVAMVDYLTMDEDCILLLLAHCKRIGKDSLRAIEKYAYSLVDDDITDAAALEERFRYLEQLHTFEGEVRSMFGMKSRALTSKEKKMLKKWCEFGYGIDVVQRAYEITVGATNTPSPSYANAILERWNSEGLKTVAEIDAKLAEEAAAKGEGTTLGNSFDTDDFFEAALKRSFAQNETV